MKILHLTKVAQELARLSKKPVVFLYLEQFPDSWPDEYKDVNQFQEVFKAVPYLRKLFMDGTDDSHQCLADDYAFIVCDDEDEQAYIYERTVGDDGPTRYNHYKGPARVYALTINRKGETQNENT